MTDPHRGYTTEPTHSVRSLEVVGRADLPGAVSWARTSRRVRLRQLVPFVLLGLLSVSLAVIPETDRDRAVWLWPAGILLITSGFQMVLMPWHRLHSLWRHAPVATFCIGVLLLREIDSQGTTGFGVLLLLPIIWQAIYGSRMDLAIAFAQITAVLVVPVLVLDGYPIRHEIPRTMLLLAVAAALGTVMRTLIGTVRDHNRAMQTVVTVSRLLHSAVDPMGVFAAGVRSLTGADAVTVFRADTGDHRGLQTAVVATPGPEPLVSQLMTPDRGHERDLASTWFLEPLLTQGEVVYESRPPSLDAPTAQWPAEVAARLVVPIGSFGSPIGLAEATWTGRPRRPSRFEQSALVLLGIDVGRALERVDEMEVLDDQAHRDGLTGLPNRRAWDDLIDHELDTAHRLHRDLAVAVIDLDHFKAYNDRHGHLAGDDLLRRAAEVWSGALRGVDILARWGGEEFVLALPGTSLEEAERVLQRLQAITPEGQSFSAGVTGLTADDDAEQVVAAADAAMYQAKAAGRNRVVSSRR